MRVIVRQRFNKEMTVCLSKQLSRETGAPRSTLEGWKAFLWSPNYLILKSFLEPNFIFLILQQRTEIISRTEKCNHCCKMNRLLLFVKLESIDRSTVDQYDLDIDRSQMMCTSVLCNLWLLCVSIPPPPSCEIQWPTCSSKPRYMNCWIHCCTSGLLRSQMFRLVLLSFARNSCALGGGMATEDLDGAVPAPATRETGDSC